jgi:superfamily II DNA/RNA helicase
MYEFAVPAEEHIALPQPPQLLFSLAVGLLGDAAAGFASQESTAAPESIRETGADNLRFAATFFDSFVATQLEQELTQEFSILCSASYYLADSPGSAAVVIGHTPPPSNTEAGGLLRTLHSILSGDLYVPWEEDEARFSALARQLLDALRAYYMLEGDDSSIIAICNELRLAAYEDGTPQQLLYADVISAICRKKLAIAVRTILPPTSGLGLEAWRPAILKEHFPKELWPAQQRICAAGLLLGRSAVIQMPTSAGKTRATELIIRSSFLSERAELAVIVAPFRSLCHDIRGDLTRAFENENVNLDEASDSYRLDLSLEQLFSRKSILIVTPEKLMYMLRRAPELGARIGLIIYDEGHQFDGMARGPTYELLLSSLKLILPQTAQVVLISAVIGNASDIATWLIGDGQAIVTGDGLLPTTKSIAFASWRDARGRLEYVSPMDPDEREFWVPRVIEQVDLPALPRERALRTFPSHKGTEVGLYLGLHLMRNGSVAVFCGRKDSVVGLCKKVVDLVKRQADFEMPLVLSDAAEIARVSALFASNMGDEAFATLAARAGVLSHHASVPQGVRLAVEHAMKVGAGKFVVCTSTLAQGVNFPIKYLIVTSVQQGQDRILVRDFHNLIGRAGRAGMHTEGSVIFSSPEIYDERTASARGRWRWQQAKELLDPANSEPSASSILALFSPYQQTVPPIVLEMNASVLQALAFADKASLDDVVRTTLSNFPIVSEREFRAFLNGRARAVQSITSYLLAHMSFLEGVQNDVVTSLASNTLAFHLAAETTRPQLITLFQGIAAAIAANVSTEELRNTIRKSPLPPASVTRLKSWIEANVPQLTAAIASRDLLSLVYAVISDEFAASALRQLSNPDLVIPSLERWIAGEPFSAIHTFLSSRDARYSGDRITIEDVVTICESAFGYDLAMIIATMADLSEELSPEVSGALGFLQKEIRYGLSSDAAIAYFESGFADRVVSQAMANIAPAASTRGLVPLALRNAESQLRHLLSTFPTYFTIVFNERRLNS